MNELHCAQVAAIFGGPVTDETLCLLQVASHGDLELARALVAAGLALGELSRHDGRWRWDPAAGPATRLREIVETRAEVLLDAQLDALERLTRPLTGPAAAVARIRFCRRAGLRLTPREQDVLNLLCEGLTAAAMARRLGVSPRTVTKHQERLYRKLGTSDRLGTVLRAQRLGIAATPS
ncbi:response regulator transcription factor [Amycolatopsis sp. lyj-109]|uniref:response regulator transcription factor n=1 Tax=Amycolatopsis sp. lyj-109 TaxID=2789287 RepID=UPI003978DE02